MLPCPSNTPPDASDRHPNHTAPPAPAWEQVERLLAGSSEWQFDAFALHDATHGRPLSTLAFYLFHQAGLLTEFQIQGPVLARFLVVVEGGYHRNPYHNATHAADVLQSLHVLLARGGLRQAGYADSSTLMACYIAAVSRGCARHTCKRLPCLYSSECVPIRGVPIRPVQDACVVVQVEVCCLLRVECRHLEW